MAEQIAEIVWLSLVAYLGAGLFIAVLTLRFGLRRLEPTTSAMPFRVRPLLAPGLMALSPLIMTRLFGMRAKEGWR